MKKLLCITLAVLSIALPKQLLSFEPTLPTVIASVWAGNSALETLSLLSRDVRHMIYGNKPVNKSAQDVLKGVLSPLNFDTPADINESRSIWPTMAGNVFSNHDSLFVSKDTLEQIKAGTPLSDQTKKDLISAALMIKNGYDAQVLAAFIAAPTAVWTSIHCLNGLLEKIKASESEKPWIKKMAALTVQCKESFSAKALIALSLTGALVLYQRHAINNQAAALLL
jgi:hypothetical protein